ncbi:MAG: hypothetical protein ACREJC_09685 [Tepidisphaeraceae bacterium]
MKPKDALLLWRDPCGCKMYRSVRADGSYRFDLTLCKEHAKEKRT